MPVPTLVATTLATGSPVSPFQTEDGWHGLALLLVAALHRPVLVLDLLNYRVCDLGWVSKSFIQSCKHPEASRLEISQNQER